MRPVSIAALLCLLAVVGTSPAGTPMTAPAAARCTWAGMARASLRVERPDGSEMTLAVRVADTPAEWAQGMQYLSAETIRRQPIWFVFETTARRGWHMRNVPIALDIAWVDAAGRVLAVGRMQPGRGGYGLGVPIRHALELAAGEAARLGIEPGARLRLLAGTRRETDPARSDCRGDDGQGGAP